MSRQRQQGCQPLHLQVRAVEAGACPPGQCITTRTVSVSAHACWQAPGGFDNKKHCPGAAAGSLVSNQCWGCCSSMWVSLLATEAVNVPMVQPL